MLYQISRNGQSYGPYTREDLERYVASGNVLPTDMALGEGTTVWVPVSQILSEIPGVPVPGGSGGGGYAGGYAAVPAPEYPAAQSPYQDPPNLNWALVLVLSIFTCSLFMFVWNIVVSAWMRRVQPRSNALYFYIGALVLLFLQGATGRTIHVRMGDMVTYYTTHPLSNLVGLALWIVRLIARFTLRANLEEHYNTVEPIGLRLSGVMTFFFGGLYFQYHLNRIHEVKRLARYRGAGY